MAFQSVENRYSKWPALNALLFDLTTPEYTVTHWSSGPVELPKDLSIKELSFRYVPLSTNSDASAIMRRGVIALSHLELAGDRWPTFLLKAELDHARRDYELASTKLRTQLLEGQFGLPNSGGIKRIDQVVGTAMKTIRFKSQTVSNDATKFVQDLIASNLVFDASNTDYFHEMLIDTKDDSPKTVGELLGFMFKYRLQFTLADRGPTGLARYQQIYDAFQQQLKEFAVENTPATQPRLPDFQTTTSGLKYRVLRQGEGVKPTVNDSVVCHYKGWLDNEVVFDDSYNRGQPAVFRVNGVIPGWVEGLQLMSVGSKFEFEIPAKLAYGKSGSGASIPPNSTLHFIVELFSSH